MVILAMIQARNGSTRLPEKVSMKLEEKTVLEHVIERVDSTPSISETLVVTTINLSDSAIVRLCAEKGIRVFPGSEEDVLDRYYQCAKLIKPDHIVRITADCPLIDDEVVETVIKKHLETGADYTSNVLEETYPDGEDVEIFTYPALEKAWRYAELLSEREHVTPYIRNNRDLFRLESVVYQRNLSNFRWTLDTQADFDFIKSVYQALYHQNPKFGMKDVLNFIEANPGLMKINHHIQRNEGYQKSILEDQELNK